MTQGFDLIGDIHGHADALENLLRQLGYVERGGVFQHGAGRQVIFLGDFIDGGPQNRRVVNVAKAMVESGHALAILGNHEYNAICWHTPDPRDPSRPLRKHSAKNRGQHAATLAEFADDPEGLAEMIAWFRTLPLYLDLEDLRVVHACWHEPSLAAVRDALGQAAVMDDDFLAASSDEESPAYEAVETLLKGPEFELPDALSFRDKYGHERRKARLRWWRSIAVTLDELVLGPQALYAATAGRPADPGLLLGYPETAPPVFFGHYWLTGMPTRQQDNVACLDYSVARGGQLVAYRWDGEQRLARDRFVW
ncbi:metallophosphoesterase [Salinisphaera hydrothermalis]|uniref:metallophosphoesterase n=1 Tax=Salinisphaera hydrothermalis TaxID=563188 RepID=UPI003341A5AF